MRQVLTLFVSTFSTLLAIINPLEADANRLSVGEFWRSISFADLKDHAIKNYLKRITDRTKGVVEVPYNSSRAICLEIISEIACRATTTRLFPARQLFLEATCASSIDQQACITAKMYAALTPNSSIPLTASRAPIICQCCCSFNPDAPRVLMESTE